MEDTVFRRASVERLYAALASLTEKERSLICEVKYRNNSHVPMTDAIVELCQDEKAKVTTTFLITKQLDDFGITIGITKHETATPILRVPVIAFLYFLGKLEVEGQNGRM